MSSLYRGNKKPKTRRGRLYGKNEGLRFDMDAVVKQQYVDEEYE